MKHAITRILCAALILAALTLLMTAAATAEPLKFKDDLADTVIFPYHEDVPDGPKFTYSYRYPQVEDSDPSASQVNDFYAYLVSDALDFGVPIKVDYLADTGWDEDSYEDVAYKITRNDDDYLSVLVITNSLVEGEESTRYAGHTFSRTDGKPGSSVALPYLLGILDTNENDTWLQDRQTEKADSIVRAMVWDIIQKTADVTPYYDDFTEEKLADIFYPEEDFYLDENGNVVFYLLPGYAAPESAGLLSFAIPLEDILDEL